MEQIKTVGVKNLKNSLSAYLREIKRGVRILVTDREQVVAELREPLTQTPVSSANPVLDQWVREGKIRLPTGPKRPLPRTGIKSPPGTAQRLIDEDREERW